MNLKRPKPSEPFLDARGLITRPWFNYLSGLSPSETSAAIEDELRALGVRVTELEDIGGALSNSTRAYGVLSVQSNGTLAGGVVVFNLVNDVQAPGNTMYYGTGPDGLKGWFNISDSIESETGQLTKVVGEDGVTTLGLADLPDAGGGTLQRFDRDEKGRVSGTSAATTDDLTEGADNLYFTAQRARDAVGGITGGALPITTGEIVDGQPIFLYGPDGRLIYGPVI